MQTAEKCKSFSGFTGICTREKKNQTEIVYLIGKTKEQKSRSFQGLAEVYAPIKTNLLTAHCIAFGEFEAASPRFHLFAKHANDGFMIRPSEYEMCGVRLGEDSRRQLNLRCAAPHIHSSLLLLAESARGSCPLLFSQSGEEGRLRLLLGWVFSRRWLLGRCPDTSLPLRAAAPSPAPPLAPKQSPGLPL